MLSSARLSGAFLAAVTGALLAWSPVASAAAIVPSPSSAPTEPLTAPPTPRAPATPAAGVIGTPATVATVPATAATLPAQAPPAVTAGPAPSAPPSPPVPSALPTPTAVPAGPTPAATGAPTAAPAAAPGRADSPVGPTPVLVEVGGAAVASVSTSPLALSPAFSPSITDYVLRCNAGENVIDVTVGAPSGQTLVAGSTTAAAVTVSVYLAEGQAAVVESDVATATQYWVRCLPHDFPALDVQKPGGAAPGYYLTGTLAGGAGDGLYAMILDGNGIPVWYAAAPGGAHGVVPISSAAVAWIGNVDEYHPNGGYVIRSLDGGEQTAVAAVGGATDSHELLPLANGDFMVLADPLLTGVDLTGTAVGARDQTIADCVVEEVDPAGRAVWSWRASDHVGIDETVHPLPITVDGATVYDVYHCNSVDVDGSGHVLVSMRHLDAVVDVDVSTARVLWKLGGSPPDPPDHAQVQHVVADGSDPAGGTSGQHDARFQPGGDISVYDDQTFTSGPTSIARGVVYHLDLATATASLVHSYPTPLGIGSRFTGGFRPGADGSNVVDWGGLLGGTGFTDFSVDGAVQLSVGFSNGDISYRTVKVPASTFDIATLRDTAGLDRQPAPVRLTTEVHPGAGYWMVTSDGGIFPFGNAAGDGSTGNVALNRPIVAMAPTPDRRGYWLVAADGGIFPFGDAAGYGSTGGMALNQPIVGMAATADGGGYWLVAADGGIFPFGDAAGYGSTGGMALNQPIVGMAATADGGGYWLVAADGGIFPFGDATGYGSTGGMTLNQPVVGMAETVDGGGYWLVARDGGIFPFGDAPGDGSTGGMALNAPVIGMTVSQDGGGYWLACSDGGLFPFGDAAGYGSLGGMRLNRPVVGVSA